MVRPRRNDFQRGRNTVAYLPVWKLTSFDA